MEKITDKDSDLVHQWGSNAEDVAYRLGAPSINLTAYASCHVRVGTGCLQCSSPLALFLE